MLKKLQEMRVSRASQSEGGYDAGAERGEKADYIGPIKTVVNIFTFSEWDGIIRGFWAQERPSRTILAAQLRQIYVSQW